MTSEEIEALQRAYQRERAARKIAEKILEDKASELFDLNQELFKTNSSLEKTVEERTKEIERIARFPSENPAPIIRVDEKGEVKYQNNAALPLIHFFKSEGINIEFEFQKWLTEVANNPDKNLRELQGMERSYQVTIVPIPEHNYVNFYFSDITEQRKAQLELEESEERYRKIVEESVDLIFKIDKDGDVIYMNPAAERFFGSDRAELLGSNYSDLLTNEYRTLFFSELRDLDQISGGGETSMFCSVITRNNSVRWLSKSLRRNKDGETSSITITAHDVTDQKIAEDKLMQSEEKYRSIIENMQLGLLEVDNDNNITKAYDHFCRLTGYSESELVGKIALDVLTDDEGRKIVEEHRKKRIKGEETVYEARILKKDGSYAWVLISGAPLYNDFGEIVGSIGIHLDITQRKNTERELIKARFKAEESSRAKEQFLANMSHEIRTPLNAIIGMTDLLIKTEINDKQQKLLSAVEVSSKNLLVVINDILDLSKIDSGKLQLEQIGFKVVDVVKHVILTKKLHSDEKGIVLDDDISIDENQVLLGDPYRLNQILLNFVSNAIKFTSMGGVKIMVYPLKSESGKQTIRFNILDTGKGIAEENLESIFEAFNQEDESITRNYGGTGLGLTITKRMIELQGGKLKVKSDIGVGSDFEFTMTYDIGSENDLPETKLAEVDTNRLKGLKILLAEDNEFNQTLMKTLFHDLDVELRVVDNGEKVLQELSFVQHDIILMDIQMPVMDGLQATIKIKGNDKLKHIPVIALTANAFKDELDKYREYGMDDCLSKPFNPDELYSKILYLTGRNDESFVFEVPLEEEGEALYNLKKLSNMMGGNKILVKKMVESFLKHTPALIQELTELAQKEQWEQVSKIAHRIKASYKTMGIDSLESSVLSLESKADSLSLSAKEAIIEEINSISKIVFQQMANEKFQNLE